MEIGEFVELVEGETPTLNSFKGEQNGLENLLRVM